MAHRDQKVTQYACEEPVVQDNTRRNIIAIPAVRISPNIKINLLNGDGV